MRKYTAILFGAILLLVGFAGVAHAQVAATPQHSMVWDQAASTLAEAQGYSYFVIVDGARSATPLANVTCSGTASPFVCRTSVPPMTPGDHTISLVATAVVNGVTLESQPSTPLPIRLIIAPGAPQNVRITAGNN